MQVHQPSAFVALLHSQLDADDVVLRLQAESGHEYDLRLRGSVLGALLLSLMSRMRERYRSQSSRTIQKQLTALLDATAVPLPDQVGSGLVLQLESYLYFSFFLTKQSITRLQAALSEADKLMASSDHSPH